MRQSSSIQLSSRNYSKPTTSIDLTNHLSSGGLFHQDDDEQGDVNSTGTSARVRAADQPAANDLDFDIQSLITSELNSIYPITLNQHSQSSTSNISKFVSERSVSDKHFFVFTSAGKLIFSQWENESHAMGLTGIIHTVMNYFNINDDTNVRQFSTFNKGSMTRFVFCNRNHIKLMVQSSRNYETTAQLQQQLDFVYSYIISSISQRNLNKLMNKRSNFDLQNYLTDLDQQLLSSICDSLSTYPRLTWFTNSLECLPMVPKIRNKLNSILSSNYLDLNISNHNGQILYTLVTSLDLKLVSILRPSNHTLHTMDLQILFELVGLQLTDLLLGKVLWFPICFPKFNDNGFLYALVKLLPNNSIVTIISSQKDSFTLLNTFVENLKVAVSKEKILDHLELPLLDWHKRFPHINHFIYKLKKTVQIYSPFKATNEMIQFYTQLRNLGEDDQGRTLNKSSVGMLRWKHTDSPGQLTGLYWNTQKFELFILLNDINLSNNAILKIAKRLIQHIRDMESYLFISKGVTF